MRGDDFSTRIPEDEADYLRALQRAPRRDPAEAVRMLATLAEEGRDWARDALAWAASNAADGLARKRAREALGVTR